MHLACEQGHKPLSVVITAGQRGDSPQFQVVLERIAVPRPGPGRPRTRPGRVLAGKAHGSRANRGYLRRRHIACTIPEQADRIRHRKNKGRRDYWSGRWCRSLPEPLPCQVRRIVPPRA